MHLMALIDFLEKRDPERVVPMGFCAPHSYRGDYHDLAFEPTEDVSVGDMLAYAKSALGETYCGYKGGEYEMGEYTRCYLARYGSTGEGIGEVLLKYMVGEY